MTHLGPAQFAVTVPVSNNAARPAAELSVIVPTLNEKDNIPILIERLDAALAGIAWEVIFVDDDSPDGTIEAIREHGRADSRIRGLRRLHRRGLAGACLEGVLASSAPLVAVIDADLQHDEKCLSRMFNILRENKCDLVVASRYHDRGKASIGLTVFRQFGSRLAVKLAQSFLKVRISDPMSGFFMLRREIIDAVAPRLSQQGFKILLDIVASTPHPIKIVEIPYAFRRRLHGQSKLDMSVVLEYLGLIVAKLSGDLVSTRFLAFGMVGSAGLIVHLAVLRTFLDIGASFTPSQSAAMLTAMTFNYTLNNALTYRDRRRRGRQFFSGLAMFAALCSFGVIAGVSVASFMYASEPRWWAAGLAGAVVGAVWNYVTNSAVTWRVR